MKKEKRAKKFNKYLVERSADGRFVKTNEDGSPKLGRCFKEGVIITQEKADILNEGWDSTERPISFFYVEDKPDGIENEEEENKPKKRGPKTRSANHKSE